MTSPAPDSAALSPSVTWDDCPTLFSDDPVKTDLELIHTACGKRLCDVPHDHTVPALVGMTTEHAAHYATGRTER